MNDHHQTRVPPFSGLDTPQPPAELRERILAGSMAALVAAPKPDLWARIWQHRTLRLAWVATVLALIAANVVITPHPGNSATPFVTVASSALPADSELSEFTRLPRLRLDARSWVAAGAEAESTIDENEGAPHPEPEENPA